MAALLAVACAHAPDRGGGSSGAQALGEGGASYYGEAFRGRKTASGERFDPDAFTAAHRTLPFGTCVRVEDMQSGRFVRVRINDRGPYVPDRLIDLSVAAARALDVIRRGVARVRLWTCGR